MRVTGEIPHPTSRHGLIALWAISLLCGGCDRRSPPAALQTVSAGTVQQYVPDSGQRFSTSISPFAHVDLAFRSGGPVEGILHVKGSDGRLRPIGIGDKVGAGTELARVRLSDYEQKVKQAQATLEEAKGQLQSAQAAQAEAQSNYDRAKSLYQTASLSKPNYDRAVQQHESANASGQSAEAAVTSAESALEQAKLALRDTVVRAPFTGWIVSRDVELGMLAGSGTKAFSMVDTQLVKATFAVPDYTLSDIRLGQRQSVLLDTLPEPVEGTVTAISQVADARSRVFSVEVTIPNPKDKIRPGMVGSLTLAQTQNVQFHLVIPLGAVVRSRDIPNGFAVLLLETQGGKTYVRNQDVQLGKTYGSSIEVLGGLVAGQRIAATGGQFLSDGQEVRVLP